MKNNKRVIMIDGDDSKWYEKAIFIINPSKLPPLNVVAEAEKIINNHFLKKYGRNMPEKPKKADKKIIRENVKKKKGDDKFLNTVLNICIVLCIILLGFIVYSFGII